MSEPKTIKINEVEYVRADSVKRNLPEQVGNAAYPYEIGKNYFIRTVTNYFTGTLLWVGPMELLLENVSWIADTGRFSNATINSGTTFLEKIYGGSISYSVDRVLSFDLED